MAWDMWEQRNNIKHNTLHPHVALAVLDIKVKLQLFCAEKDAKDSSRRINYSFLNPKFRY